MRLGRSVCGAHVCSAPPLYVTTNASFSIIFVSIQIFASGTLFSKMFSMHLHFQNASYGPGLVHCSLILHVSKICFNNQYTPMKSTVHYCNNRQIDLGSILHHWSVDRILLYIHSQFLFEYRCLQATFQRKDKKLPRFD